MSSGLLQEGKNEGHSMSVSPLTNVYEIKYNKDPFRFYTGQSTLEPWTQIVLPNNIM